MVNANNIGPYVFVFFCVYFFRWLQTLCLLQTLSFFWNIFFACLLLLIGGFGFNYLLMGLLYYCQMSCLFGCTQFFILLWSPLFCCA